MFKKILRFILLLVLLVALAFGGLLLYGTLTDYQPEDLIELQTNGDRAIAGEVDSTVSMLIWNIGFSGLGAASDFFYDGGEMVRPTKEVSLAYLDGIVDYIDKQDSLDFILIQEADRKSKRSWEVDQVGALSGKLSGFSWNFALNYKVKYIPIPFTEPMGKVFGGLVTYSRFAPTSAARHQFPGNYSWPNRIYFLDRCFMVQRFDAPGDAELLVINTHNSAYDDGGLKKQQMAFLHDFLVDEYEKGNYIIVGGDWNQCPPGFDPYTFGRDDEYTQLNIAPDYLPADWLWAFDATTPTNRKVSTPYVSGETYTTLIDFFLVSPNVELKQVRGEDLDFAYSDHQPVYLRARLK